MPVRFVALITLCGSLLTAPALAGSEECRVALRGLDANITDTEQEVHAGYGWFEPELIHILPKTVAYRLHELKFYDYGEIGHHEEIRRFIQKEFDPTKLRPLSANQVYSLFKLTAELIFKSIVIEEYLVVDALSLLADQATGRGAAFYGALSAEQKTDIRLLIEDSTRGNFSEQDMKEMYRAAARFGDTVN